MDVSLVLFKKDGSRKAFSLPSSVTVIGRRSDCDLYIPLMPISRRHCQLNHDEGVLKIRDLGCGMDAETLRKATQPFFSAKAAGRKRGMGLAYTARFLQINGGTLDIESEPGIGTTVTILLRSA